MYAVVCSGDRGGRIGNVRTALVGSVPGALVGNGMARNAIRAALFEGASSVGLKENKLEQSSTLFLLDAHKKLYRFT